LKDYQDELQRNGIYNVTDLFWRLVEVGKPELEKLISLMNRPLPRFEQVNCDPNGVKIHDREIQDTVQVYFKPTGVRCGYDDSSQCSHITFALSIPAVANIIRKRRSEGWQLPDI